MILVFCQKWFIAIFTHSNFEKILILQLVDFESWKTIISRSEKNSGAISCEGAVCVLPSSLDSRHLDVQGNIYAFGVLLLELISGRPPFCKNKGCLVDWVSTKLADTFISFYISTTLSDGNFPMIQQCLDIPSAGQRISRSARSNVQSCGSRAETFPRR